jgi:hypothetical protein
MYLMGRWPKAGEQQGVASMNLVILNASQVRMEWWRSLVTKAVFYVNTYNIERSRS